MKIHQQCSKPLHTKYFGFPFCCIWIYVYVCFNMVRLLSLSRKIMFVWGTDSIYLLEDASALEDTSGIHIFLPLVLVVFTAFPWETDHVMHSLLPARPNVRASANPGKTSTSSFPFLWETENTWDSSVPPGWELYWWKLERTVWLQATSPDLSS